MLHSRVYNEGLTPDLKTAIVTRDFDFVAREILRLCAAIADRGELLQLEGGVYDDEMTRLYICLAINDAQFRGAQTIQLIGDMINF